ncbi:uncharacterized protein LOC122504019 [Leptopilina heterotoma]|uniref:uncharacterized protein LOC122504019 n=1 Tax=Leptopilina heterotoma TaxID=63436 RepID=UPI001CA9C67C|nr:uncharacterized protein LOC122504019 [Leptopilina heterotoma]
MMKLILFLCFVQLISLNYATEIDYSHLNDDDLHDLLETSITKLENIEKDSRNASEIFIKRAFHVNGNSYLEEINSRLSELISIEAVYIQDYAEQLLRSSDRKCEGECIEVLRNSRAEALNNYTICLNKKNDDIKTLDVKFDLLHKTNINFIEENIKTAKKCRENENRACILKVNQIVLKYLTCLSVTSGFRSCNSNCVNPMCLRRYYQLFLMPDTYEFKQRVERECQMYLTFKLQTHLV